MQGDSGHSTELIRCRGVQLGYGRRTVLSALDLEVREGERLGLVGPNGGGKTTLLRHLLGLLPQQAGVSERPAGSLRFGYVPQRDVLDDVWPLRAVELVLMGLYADIGLMRRPTSAHRESAVDALDQVGLAGLADARYSELSGGQKQRVLVARALVSDPQLLVLDEPTDNMDLPSTAALAALLTNVAQERGMTLIWATHDLNTVAGRVDRVALVSGGRVLVGSAEEILTDAHLSEIYGVPVVVSRVDGRTLIFVRDGGHATVVGA